MSPRTSGRPGRRLFIAIPAVAVPVAIAAVILVPMQAVGAVDLPDKTPQELLAFVQSEHVDQLSGTLEQTSDLGIPDLSALLGGSGSSEAPTSEATTTTTTTEDLLALATGSYSARVYLDQDRARLQVLDDLAERNIYVDADAATGWFVDSESQTATRVSLPDRAALEKPAPPADAGSELPTPEAMLERALADLDESTDVTVGTDGRVAGRDAYELVLTPRSDSTLVGSVRFAIDGENGTALAASVTARGADQPAFQVAFTDVSFAAPDPADLSFTPSAQLTVTEKEITLPTAVQVERWRADAEAEGGTADAAAPTVIGDDWSTVIEVGAPADGSALDRLSAEQRQLVDTVTTPVTGGRAFETALLTVLITDDGRILAGAVPVERLVDAAGSGR
ncbi:outer membrane lipoprotein carrier protein LolA [Microbacterium sp. P02]|uniref:LolA family protein n=1 Tax=Microbacterium sp. P02 TaxID=3366260 RepID=UPI0036704BD8